MEDLAPEIILCMSVCVAEIVDTNLGPLIHCRPMVLKGELKGVYL